jgi:VWFA-related protein
MRLALSLATFLVLCGAVDLAGQTLTSGTETRCAQLFDTTPNVSNSSVAKDAILNITALDVQGHPVRDLTSTDLQIFDDGKPQQISCFKASAAQATTKNPAPTTTLILFDLLNSIPGRREDTSTLIIRALEPLETGDSVYLYLLTNRGDIYPVHALGVPPQTMSPSEPGGFEENGKPTDAPWTQQIHPLLDQAIQNVNRLRLKDYTDQGVVAAATFLALNELGEKFIKIPGPKTIVWLTRGVPNWLDYPYGCRDAIFPEGSGSYVAGKCGTDCTRRAVSKCIDYTPFLRHFSAKLARIDTVIYSVEVKAEGALPPADRGRAKDTLQQLADLTGGRMYSNGEVERAISDSLKNARARYQLAYAAPLPDGKYHKLSVVCTHEGVRIESQQGYFAAQP